jgi:hypothetical protein
LQLGPGRGSNLVSARIFWHKKFTMSITGARKGPGRPRVGSTSVNLRLPPAELAVLDQWIEAQTDAPTRPEAARRLLRQALGKLAE